MHENFFKNVRDGQAKSKPLPRKNNWVTDIFRAIPEPEKNAPESTKC